MRYSLLHKSAMSDLDLYELFDRLQDAGRVESASYDGSVTDRHSFRDLCRSEFTHFWAGLGDGDPLGYFILNGAEHHRAWMHFALFGRVHPICELRMAQHSLSFVLGLQDEDGPLLDVVYGLTPITNSQAIRFIKLVGFRQCGMLPHGAYDAVRGCNVDACITYADRTIFPVHATREEEGK